MATGTVGQTPIIDFNGGSKTNTLGKIYFNRATDDVESNNTWTTLQDLEVTDTDWLFNGPNAAGDGMTNRVRFRYNGTEGVTFTLINGETGAGGTKTLNIDYKTIQTGGSNVGNSSLRFGSANGKYNFFKVNGTSGYQIDAEGGSAGYILPEEAAKASNYDAEGEYIGPVFDRVADLKAKVETLQQEKADLLATVNDLVARVEALEGA